jgi:hypothetical protein
MTAVDLDSTLADYALKEVYKGQVVQNLVYKNNPFLAMVDKDESFYGRNYPLPTIYGIPQGRSADIAKAFTGQVPTKGVEFLLTHSEDNAVANITDKVLKQASTDLGSFIRLATNEIDGALHTLSLSLGIDIWRNGSGSRGQVGALSTTSLTLLNVDDVVNFEVGQVLVANDSDDSTSARSGSSQITAINRDTGVLTSANTWTSDITSLAVNDYLFVDGDMQTGKLKGVAAWDPIAAPASTSFYGVNRTIDATRLGGVRKDISTITIEEGLIDLRARLEREGSRPDFAFVNNTWYANVEKSLTSRVRYVDVKVSADIGFPAIEMHGIKLVADRNVIPNYTWMLMMDHIKLYSMGKCPHIMDGDNQTWLRRASSKTYEVVATYYAALGCEAPGWNGNGKLA